MKDKKNMISKKIVFSNNIEKLLEIFEHSSNLKKYDVYPISNGYCVVNYKEGGYKNAVIMNKRYEKLAEIETKSDIYFFSGIIQIMNGCKIRSANDFMEIKKPVGIAVYGDSVYIKDEIKSRAIDVGGDFTDKNWLIFLGDSNESANKQYNATLLIKNIETGIVTAYHYLGFEGISGYKGQYEYPTDCIQTSRRFVLVPFFDHKVYEFSNVFVLQTNDGKILFLNKLLDELKYYDGYDVSLKDNYVLVDLEENIILIRLNNKGEFEFLDFKNSKILKTEILSDDDNIKNSATILINTDEKPYTKIKVISSNGNVSSKEIDISPLKNRLLILSSYNTNSQGIGDCLLNIYDMLSKIVKTVRLNDKDYVIIDEIGVFNGDGELIYKLKEGQYAALIDDKTLLVAENKYIANTKQLEELLDKSKFLKLKYDLYVVNLENSRKAKLNTNAVKIIDKKTDINLSPFTFDNNKVKYEEPLEKDNNLEFAKSVELDINKQKQRDIIKLEITKYNITNESELDEFVSNLMNEMKNKHKDALIVIQCFYSAEQISVFYLCDFKNNIYEKTKKYKINFPYGFEKDNIVTFETDGNCFVYDANNGKMVLLDKLNTEFKGSIIKITDFYENAYERLRKHIYALKDSSKNNEALDI